MDDLVRVLWFIAVVHAMQFGYTVGWDLYWGLGN